MLFELPIRKTARPSVWVHSALPVSLSSFAADAAGASPALTDSNINVSPVTTPKYPTMWRFVP